MAVKPIISIEVDDSAFKRFYELFEQFSEETKALPDDWRALGAAMGEGGEALKEGALGGREALALAAAQATVIAEALHKATKAQEGFGHATSTSGKAMSALHASAQGVGKAISFVVGGIGKLAAFAGLGALFGGFGIGELTSAAFNRLREAGRLGISPGELASFQVHAQPYLGTGALEGAANAKIDITKAGYLAALGISQSAALGMTTADLAFQELIAARAAYKAAAPGTEAVQPAVMAYQALGGDIGDVRLAAMRTVEELQKAQHATRADSRSLDFSTMVGMSWTNLKIALDKAGFSIQTSLINNLAILAPRLEVLTADVAAFITGFINTPLFAKFAQSASDGLGNLAHFLEGVDWVKGEAELEAFFTEIPWKELGTDIVALGGNIKWALQALHLIPQDKDHKDNLWDAVTANNATWDDDALVKAFKAMGWKLARFYQHGVQSEQEMLRGQSTNAFGPADAAGLHPGQYGKSSSIPGLDYDALLYGIRAHESSSYSTVNKIGAMGAYQFMPDTLDAILKQDARFAPWVKKYGVGTDAMYKAFLDTPKLQDWAALDNVQNAISAGAKSPADIGEFWLGGAGGLRNPSLSDRGANGPGTTAYQHGQDIQGSYDWALRHADSSLSNIFDIVDADIARYGKNWVQHLPKDAAKIVAEAHLPASASAHPDTASIHKLIKAVLAQRNKPVPVAITVSTPTGASVSKSTNAAAVHP